jgi:hypothetical protein
MKDRLGLLLGIAVLAGALSACSKPASDTAEDAGATASDAAAATSTAATDAGSGAMDAGGAVSPPSSPQNDPINTDTNKGEATQTPGSSSFTEAQARGHIENAGYTSVSGLTKTPDGMWSGSAQKGGKTMQVSVDFKGAVSAK